jgi:hypothetical protein
MSSFFGSRPCRDLKAFSHDLSSALMLTRSIDARQGGKEIVGRFRIRAKPRQAPSSFFSFPLIPINFRKKDMNITASLDSPYL